MAVVLTSGAASSLIPFISGGAFGGVDLAYAYDQCKVNRDYCLEDNGCPKLGGGGGGRSRLEYINKQ